MVIVSARKSSGLTPEDLETLAAGVTAGKRVTVYLADPVPSLGLEAGASARVVSVDGSTVTVSPKGVDDQLPFEANELQRTRVSATTPAATRRRPAAAPITSGPSQPRTAAPAPPTATANRSKGAAAPKAVTSSKTPAPVPKSPAEDHIGQLRAQPATPKPTPVRATRSAKSSKASVSVTVTASGEGPWTVVVSTGSKKHKSTEVSADRVARAMRELGDDVAIDAVDGVIAAAREAAQKRIDELSLELETARAALAQLDGNDEGH
ncbi:DUF6319 family protein [Gordonia sp. NB41Y]|uniref:DUF6319 family protein n=1 Tax=Gordonia sp. NB41Y TaxID=875808 RepID=UPI00273A886A|nr:DUF6319 family protein [Gordonia sp. NB41Y]WLP90747.1 DUF6319 family protein [Gordonia sp. NB41Y]